MTKKHCDSGIYSFSACIAQLLNIDFYTFNIMKIQ
jgi:hypothetical protein